MIPAIFLFKTSQDRPRKEKENFVPNSVPIRPRLENSKKNSQKIKNIKKYHSGNISIQTGFR